MIVIKSEKLGGEVIIICENKEEFDNCTKKADELGACLYTKREVEYLNHELKDDDKNQMLRSINNVKKAFLGFLVIPKDWTPNGKSKN